MHSIRQRIELQPAFAETPKMSNLDDDLLKRKTYNR